jgi:hypothetical protein
MHWQNIRLLLALACATFQMLVSHPGPAIAEEDWKGRGTGDYALLSPSWPCDAAFEAEKSLPVLNKAILWNTFGTDTTCLTRYLKEERMRNMEIHLINEVCQRNKQCGNYEFLYGMTPAQYNKQLRNRNPALIARLKEYMAAPAQYLAANLGKQTTCYISPGLESNLTMQAAAVLMEITREAFPNCQMVWNPAGINRYGKPMSGTHFEIHGSQAKLQAPCVADLDGEDISFPSRPAILPNFIDSSKLPAYFAKYQACDLRFLWIAESNGIAKGPFIDPRLRTAFPTPATFGLLASALHPVSSGEE